MRFTANLFYCYFLNQVQPTTSGGAPAALSASNIEPILIFVPTAR
jgi:hypothetical protein